MVNNLCHQVRAKFIKRDSLWYSPTSEGNFGPNNINRFNGIEIPGALIPTMKIKKHDRRLIRQGPANVDSTSRETTQKTIKMETHLSQPTTVIHIVARNHSTLSPDEDQQ